MTLVFFETLILLVNINIKRRIFKQNKTMKEEFEFNVRVCV